MNNSKVCTCLFVRINSGFFVHAITKRDQPKKALRRQKNLKRNSHSYELEKKNLCNKNFIHLAIPFY